MAYLRLGVLVIAIASAVVSGCVASHEKADIAQVSRDDDRVNDTQTEVETGLATKVGVIDMMEVLKRAKIGRPAMARWKRDVEEANRWKDQHMTQFSRARQYHQRWENPWETARKHAINSIIPTVEIAAKVIAEKHGFGIVMAKGDPETVMTTFYSATTVDLTEQVIDELNRLYP